MEGLHSTLIPCRAVRMYRGVTMISGATNFVWTQGSFPHTERRAAAYVRLQGYSVKGELRLTLAAPDGRFLYDEDQPVPPFDAAGVAETWFEADWFKFRMPGKYTMRLELDGSLLLECVILAVE